MNFRKIFLLFILVSLFQSDPILAQKLYPVGNGWANNSVNVTSFRKNSVATIYNIQFTAYYDAEGYLTLAKRVIGSKKWTVRKSKYKGNVKDAHNVISIMPDGDGYLHVSWDHHSNKLRYARGLEPYGLELGKEESMTGLQEMEVTYPEFYKMADGGLLFIYRDGASGKGNLVMNRYDLVTKKWEQIQSNLISGEGARNAYWQACVDRDGTIHVSWVWRETPDVETNHDLCYARSLDGGKTWYGSSCNDYTLPITASTAEYITYIPQGSDLINQTTMTTDNIGRPFIATYWNDSELNIPQYRVVYMNKGKWYTLNLDFRKTPFTLGGEGTKRIPVSRPQLVAKWNNDVTSLYLLFRDEERGNKVSMAVCKDITLNKWELVDLTDFSVGSWEPSIDTELWRDKELLNIFVQKAEQVDAEGEANIAPQKVQILEVDKSYFK